MQLAPPSSSSFPAVLRDEYTAREVLLSLSRLARPEANRMAILQLAPDLMPLLLRAAAAPGRNNKRSNNGGGGGNLYSNELMLSILIAVEALVDGIAAPAPLVDANAATLAALQGKLAQPDVLDIQSRNYCLTVLFHLELFTSNPSSSSQDIDDLLRMLEVSLLDVSATTLTPGILPNEAAKLVTRKRLFRLLPELLHTRPVSAAQHVFAKHTDAFARLIVQWMPLTSSINSNNNNSSELKALAVNALYYLSCAPANQPVLLRYPGMLTALLAAAPPHEPVLIAQRTHLCTINLTRAAASNVTTPTMYSPKQFDDLFDVFRSVSTGESTWELNQSLLALRYLFASEPVRAKFWTQHGGHEWTKEGMFLISLYQLLDMAVSRQLPDATDNALTIFVQLSADAKPQALMRYMGRLLASMVSRIEVNINNNTSPPAASSSSAMTLKVGRLLLKQLESLPPVDDAVEKRPGSMYPLSFVHPAVWRSWMNEDWDAAMTELANVDKVSTLLYQAVAKNAPFRLIQYLLTEKHADANEPSLLPDRNSTPLLLALNEGRADVALLLLDHGANTRVKNAGSNTPLILSCSSSSGLLPITRRLIELGSDLDHVSTSNSGRSALDWCCNSYSEERLQQGRLLLQTGASPNRLPNSYGPPLSTDVGSGNLPMVKLLLEFGADATEPTGEGGSVLGQLGHAICRGKGKDDDALVEILELLLAHGAPTTRLPGHLLEPFHKLTFFIWHAPRLMRRCVEVGADVNGVLRSAVRYGPVENVGWCLCMGADPAYSVKNDDDSPRPLLVCAASRRDLSRQDQYEMVRVLLLAGADVDAGGPVVAPYPYDEDGHSGCRGVPPLWVAVEMRNADIARLLLQGGANHSGVQYGGKTLLSLARSQLPIVVPWLEEDPAHACGELDPEGKGLDFVFTHCAGCRLRGDGTNLQGCSGCVMVAYCGADCQAKHWPVHKTICKKKKEMDDKRRRMRGEKE